MSCWGGGNGESSEDFDICSLLFNSAGTGERSVYGVFDYQAREGMASHCSAPHLSTLPAQAKRASMRSCRKSQRSKTWSLRQCPCLWVCGWGRNGNKLPYPPMLAASAAAGPSHGPVEKQRRDRLNNLLRECAGLHATAATTLPAMTHTCPSIFLVV